MGIDPGILAVYVNDNVIERNATIDLGDLVVNSINTFTIKLANEGDAGTYVVIDKDSSTSGIIITGDGSLTAPSITEKDTVVIDKGDSVSFSVKPTTSSLGNKTINFTITSNDLEGSFKFLVIFSVVSASTSTPVINVLYNNQSVEANSSLNLGDIPYNTTEEVTFSISNLGTPTLVLQLNGITLMSLNDTISFSSNPVESTSVSLALNEISTFKINLGALSLGNKSAIITIVSNDTNENPFIFSIEYNVVKAYDFVVKYSTQELSRGETVNLGSFNIKTDINKTITATNKGLFYNIRVLAVLAEGDVILSNIPSLPLILHPEEANVFQFNAKFSSTSLGKKNASIDIQWEVVS